MNDKKPLILVTNDDGISAKGILSLVEVAQKFGDVVVVAPDKPQSGMGHAITINHPLRLNKSLLFPGIESFTCSGTPVDCVKLGIFEVLKRRPDLLVSGINHGANTSSNVLYSGTMSAAVEGAMENIPSIGFSLYNYDSDADFSTAKMVAEKMIQRALEGGFPQNICLNVNVPDLSINELKGIKICKQANAFWNDSFDKRLDQFGKPYFWLTGDFELQNTDPETDLQAIEQGYASVVPTQFDMTAYSALETLKNWNL